MKSKGSLVTVGLIALAVGVGAGCKKKDEPPKPDPAATAAAQSGLPNARRPPHNGMMNRVPPEVTKEYRLDVCYYGTFSLGQARDVYLASLGKDEPSLKKLPSFGAPGSNVPPGSPSAAAALGKVPPPKPVAAVGDAGAPPVPSLLDRRNELALRLPHERNARACTAAMGLKEPAMGDVDTQVLAYAPFVTDLARDITMAQQYYQHEEYTKDGFAKGKELDKKLRDGFAKLDDLHGKVGAALAAWFKEHPQDTSKMEEGEKATRAFIDDARDVFLLVMNRKVEGDGWKAAVDKLEKSAASLKTYGDAHPNDTWPKILSSRVEAFVKTVKEGKVMPDKTFEPEAYLNVVTNFVGLIEGRQQAISRAAMTHVPMIPSPNAPVPSATPPAAP